MKKEQWKEYNQKAGEYYEEKCNSLNSSGEKFSQVWQQYRIESVYHWIQSNHKVGLIKLREAFEEAQTHTPETMPALYSLARGDHDFKTKNQAWMDYFESRLELDPEIQISKLTALQDRVQGRKKVAVRLHTLTSLGIILFIEYFAFMGQA